MVKAEFYGCKCGLVHGMVGILIGAGLRESFAARVKSLLDKKKNIIESSAYPPNSVPNKDVRKPKKDLLNYINK